MSEVSGAAAEVEAVPGPSQTGAIEPPPSDPAAAVAPAAPGAEQAAAGGADLQAPADGAAPRVPAHPGAAQGPADPVAAPPPVEAHAAPRAAANGDAQAPAGATPRAAPAGPERPSTAPRGSSSRPCGSGDAPPVRARRRPLEALVDRLEDPLVARELRPALRHPGALAAFVLALGASAAALVGPVVRAVDRGEVEVGATGRSALATFVLALLVALVAAVPVRAATAIVEERTRRSLDLLIATGLGPGRIVRGKLLAVLLQFALVLAATPPLAAVAWLLGGATLAELGQAYLLLVVAVIAAAAHGLWVSSGAPTAARAVLKAAATGPLAGALLVGPLAALVLGDLAPGLLRAFAAVPGLGELTQVARAAPRAAALVVATAWALLGAQLALTLAADPLRAEADDRLAPRRRWFLAAWALALGAWLLHHATTPPPGPEALATVLGLGVLGFLGAALLLSVEPLRPRRLAAAAPGLAARLVGARVGAGLGLVLGVALVHHLVLAAAVALRHGDLGWSYRLPAEVLAAWGVPFGLAFVVATTMLAAHARAGAAAPRATRLAAALVLALAPVGSSLAWLAHARGARPPAVLLLGSPLAVAESLVLERPRAAARGLMLGAPAERELQERLGDHARALRASGRLPRDPDLAQREVEAALRAVRRDLLERAVPLHVAAAAAWSLAALLLVAASALRLARARDAARAGPPDARA